MRDLQEIRRFWPNAVEIDFDGPMYIARPLRNFRFIISKSLSGRWMLTDSRSEPEVVGYRGPTIAAAMAAAGFAERKKGFFAEYNEVDTAVWLRVTKRHADKCAGKTRIQRESRQRPRKGVRLGRHGRRLALAASIGEALDLVRQKRQDRREIGR